MRASVGTFALMDSGWHQRAMVQDHLSLVGRGHVGFPCMMTGAMYRDLRSLLVVSNRQVGWPSWQVKWPRVELAGEVASHEEST